jgi:hypothetical protein
VKGDKRGVQGQLAAAAIGNLHLSTHVALAPIKTTYAFAIAIETITGTLHTRKCGHSTIIPSYLFNGSIETNLQVMVSAADPNATRVFTDSCRRRKHNRGRNKRNDSRELHGVVNEGSFVSVHRIEIFLSVPPAGRDGSIFEISGATS